MPALRPKPGLLASTPVALALLVASSAAPAQAHHDIPQFDAASIKPTPPADDKTLVQITPDGASFRGAPVRIILETAFGIDDSHLIGAPSWTGTKRYDIQAKVSPEDAPKLDKLTGGERNAMLIPLLIDRFSLKYHHETREFQIYALKVAKGGPKLTKGEPEPAGGLKFPDPDHPVNPSEEHFKVMTTMGHIEADSVPMFVLADQLTRLNAVGRAVVDKTNITGNYNFTLRWAADRFPLLHDAEGLGSATEKDENTPSSLFTALQEQLGLKLEPQKDHVDVIVIDHIEPPSPN